MPGHRVGAIRQAFEADHDVIACARPADGISLSSPKLQKVRGDALNTRDVEAALQGIDVVIQTLGVGLGDLFRPVHLFSEATRVLVAAMTAQGGRRLICVTGFGAGDSRESISCLQRIPFRVMLGQAYDDKSVLGRLITESLLDRAARARSDTKSSKRPPNGEPASSRARTLPTSLSDRSKITPTCARLPC